MKSWVKGFLFSVLIISLFSFGCGGGGGGGDTASNENNTNNTNNGSGESAPPWGNPILIADQPHIVSCYSRAKFDSSGNAMVLWIARDDIYENSQHLYSNTYIKNSGWGTPTRVDNLTGYVVTVYPKICSDSKGNFMVAWIDGDPSLDNGSVYVNRYEPSKGWGTAKKLSDNLQTKYQVNVDLAMDSSGNAIAVWTTYYNNIYYSKYSPETDWSSPQIAYTNPTYCRNISMEIDNTGNAIAVFKSFPNGSPGEIKAINYRPTTGWSDPVLLLDDPSYNNSYFLQMSNLGFAKVILVKATDPTDPLKASVNYEISCQSYYPNNGWSQPELLSSLNGYDSLLTSFLDFKMNNNGDAILVWNQNKTKDDINNMVCTYTFHEGSGWSSPMLFSGWKGSTAINTDGNAIITWAPIDGSSHCKYKFYDKNTGWGPAGSMYNDSYYTNYVAMDSSGNALSIISDSVVDGKLYTQFYK
jgi:hypothetical protein